MEDKEKSNIRGRIIGWGFWLGDLRDEVELIWSLSPAFYPVAQRSENSDFCFVALHCFQVFFTAAWINEPTDTNRNSVGQELSKGDRKV